MLQRQTEKVAGIKRWCLDFPVQDEQRSPAELTDQGLLFQGWILREQLEEIEVELQHGGQTDRFALNVARPDVIRIILKTDASNHPQLHCGFAFKISPKSRDFLLGIRWRGQFVPWFRGELSGEFKVLKGFEHWLFLDNDTNQSVEQHLGKLLLSPDCQLQWQQYFASSQLYHQQWHKPFAMLLAPSKEAIYPQYHPYPRSAHTAIEQLLSLCPAGYPLIYPQAELRAAAQPTFPKTDTHWTTYGAGLATIELAVALGFARQEVAALFASDQYRTVSHCGDLGNKLYPQQRSDELLQASFSCHTLIRYDNKLANFGRIMVIENPKALHSGHCLQFGSSSSYSMLNFISRLFGRVTLIHTAGNIDPAMVTLLAPDFVVAQSNARFVVRAPVTNYQLPDVMRQKLAVLAADERTALVHKAQQMASNSDSPAVAQVHQLLLDAVAAVSQPDPLP